MRVVVVCTGNVARSPALGVLLQAHRPDLQIETAAVGVNAHTGQGMRRQMRELLVEAGYGEQAYAHHSRRWDALQDIAGIDLAVGVAPVHMKRLAELAPDVMRLQTIPVIKDPAYGPAEGYLLAWVQIKLAAEWLAQEL